MDDEVVRQTNRRAYGRLDRALKLAGLGQHAQFLNWGYAPVAGFANEADGPAPDAGPNAMQERLVAELIGRASLDQKRLLDVGCGRGGSLVFMQRHYRPLALSGIDLSAANVERARQALGGAPTGTARIRLQVADACALPQTDASQDIVFNLESSGAYPDLVSFFEHVRRVLVEDGLFLYGDVWPATLITPLRHVLDGLGFSAEIVRDVTPQVLAARGLASAGILGRLSQADPDLCADTESYFALPGSAIWESLERGDLRYILGRWRRTSRPRSPRPDGERSLCSRSERLQALLQQGADRTESKKRWFPFGSPGADAAINVLAFPYAVGGASAFRGWLHVVPKDWAFCPVQLPGREQRLAEPAFRTVETAVEALLPLVLPFASRPLALVGWSLGCKLAFEFARRWEERTGQPPRLLLLGACPSPRVSRSNWQFLEGENWAARLRALGGTPEAVLASSEMLGTLEGALHGDFEMAARYRCEATIRAPIFAVAAEDDKLVSVDEVSAWRHCTSGGFSMEQRPGGHFLVRESGRQIPELMVEKLSGLLGAGSIGHSGERSVCSSSNAWFPCNRLPLPDATRLICFHHAGGNAQSYRDWTSHPALGKFAVCPVELPGRGTRYGEAAARDLTGLIDACWPHFRDVIGTEQPVVLFGHSLGALVAYEVARRMQADDRPPAALIASARRAPTSVSPEPWRHMLQDGELVDELQRLGGTAAEILRHRELLDLVLPTIRSDFALTETYLHPPGSKLSCPVIAIRGTADHEVSAGDLDRWQEVSSARFERWTFDGDHFYLNDATIRDRLLDRLVSRVASLMSHEPLPRAAALGGAVQRGP
ncbi:alpha/beta fold hydrolase [Rhodopseudomonas palustris]|uniref:Thioesterase n=1 Tax=Rhodopseudomonas palustris (strain BisB18) TaxID=316056 RepID=Q212V8_RHOPB